MPDQTIAFPFPTQIAAGQPLDANAVQQDFIHVASKFNVHGHAYGEISGAPAQAASGGDVWLPGEIKMFPGPYVPSVVGCIMPCLGATFFVASVHPACASTVGTWHGGNASILKLPDYGGRAIVGLATAGHTSVAAPGGNEGVATVALRPAMRHRHSPHNHGGNTGGPSKSVTEQGTNGFSANTSLGGSDGLTSTHTHSIAAGDGGSGVTTDPLDGPAYSVAPFYIRVL